MKTNKTKSSVGSRHWFIAAGLGLFIIFCIQPVLAVTTYMYFSVNGDTTGIHQMVQGDTVFWGANCGVGDSMTWYIWYDINGDSVIDDPGDFLLASFTATDGDTINENGPGDNNPTPDGMYIMSPMILGVPAGQYIFKAKNLVDNSTVEKVLTCVALTSPPNTFSGWVTIAGHPAPDAALENVYIEAEQKDQSSQMWGALTNDSGRFTINVGEQGTGLEFQIGSAEISGYVRPSRVYDTASGSIDSIMFEYLLASDSVYGLIKDQDDSLLKISLSVYCSPISGSGEKNVNTSDGRYMIPFSSSEQGSWNLGISSDELVPHYMVPNSFEFSNVTLHGIRHDFVCLTADTVLYAKVTENGNHPTHRYMIQERNDSLECWTQAISDTGGLNVVALHISKRADSGWSASLATWDTAYAIPAGYVLEGTSYNNLHPGDTAHLNLISGVAFTDTVKYDVSDTPPAWDSLWVYLWASQSKSYGTRPGSNGVYTIYADTGVYSLGINGNGYLASPSNYSNVHVTGNMTGGYEFFLNRAQCKVRGTLTNVPLPLGPGVYVSATGTSGNGYGTSAQVDTTTGAYTLYLCDGEWTIYPPSITNRISPGSAQLTISNAPDTARTVNFAYTLISDVNGAGQHGSVPTVYAMRQNYPNPFNPTTQIAYDLPAAGSVKLTIYDLLGQVVKVLVDGEMAAGRYTALWDGTDNHGQSVASGIYFYRVAAGSFTQSKKMLLLK